MTAGQICWAETGSCDRMRPGTPHVEKRIRRAHCRALHQQGEDGPLGEREDGAGRQPEDKDRRRGDAQGEGEGGAGRTGNRDLPERGEHVHVDDRPQVVVDRHGAVQHAEDGQPDVAVFHRRAEQVELPDEARGGRDPGQRHEKQREQAAEHGVAESDPPEIPDVVPVVLLVREEHRHAEGAHVHAP